MKTMLFSCLLMACALSALADHGNSLIMKQPVSTWANYPASMKDVEIEVTPLGIYATIDLIFTVGPSLNPPPGDSQEAVIFFDLPQGSYVHDSWLWLDPTTIISAELMERRKASEIYANIVKRRRDPSLLMNMLPQGYQLNIYPVSSGYWRKVKITYSTPIRWQGGRANVPLPLELLNASQTAPAFSLNVGSNGVFYNPAFVERPFGSWVSSQSGNSTQLSIPAAAYTGNSTLTLSYEHYHTNDARLSVYPTRPTEGVYELIVPPTAQQSAARAYNFVIDHRATGGLYSAGELRRAMHQLMSTMLKPTDQFNIFFRAANGTISSLFSTWHFADSAGINGIAGAFSGTHSPSDASFRDLLKTAILFTASGPADAETILLNGNSIWMNATSVQNVTTALKSTPGALSRKLRVIDYSVTATAQNSANPANFHGMLADLTATFGGSYIHPESSYYDAYTQRTIYDFNLADALYGTICSSWPGTSIYNVNMPLTGFTHNEFSISTGRRYSPYATYTESGRYYGNFNNPDSVRIDYAGAGSIVSASAKLANVSAGDSSFNQAWNYNNNKALALFGNVYRQEIIDSSIRHRVLSDFTAFLALETGDTIKASVGQSLTYFPISTVGPQAKTGTLTAYPNPFRDQLTIESSVGIREIRVYTVGGSLVLSKVFPANVNQWTWDGHGEGGSPLPAGMYLVRVSGEGQSAAIRVNKLSN